MLPPQSLSSLPMRGEWIEIRPPCPAETCPWRLSPCGESGLKLSWRQCQRLGGRSLPMRGEWIEIRSLCSIDLHRSCLSPCGESGLKSRGLAPLAGGSGLSPCGESGLKFVGLRASCAISWSLPMRGEWIEIGDHDPAGLDGPVSPHAGRVD